MLKLIIWIPGKPLLHGYKRREFIWSAPHGCYLYGGAEIEAADFNAKYEKATRTNSDLNPRVKVVDPSQDAAATPAAPASTIAAKEITLEDAESVMRRLAPERLKKKTGPKPREAEMEVA